MSNYQMPVARLLDYELDYENNSRDWPDYVELFGLTTEHIAELIRMAIDPNLHDGWAPVHAWRSLGQLGAIEAVEPLLNLGDDHFDLDYWDWYSEEIPQVVALIGPSAVPKIKNVLATPTSDWRWISAIDCVKSIYQKHPQTRQDLIVVLQQQLANFAQNTPDFNGFMIAGLCDLEAVEAAETIEQAFAAKAVDFTITGDWLEVQVELGFKKRSEVPIRGFRPTEAFELSAEAKALRRYAELRMQRSQPKGFGGQKQANQKKTKKTKRAKKKR
jgi:hypothetical protein